ncbi:hypothetical protein [Bacillus sp. NPDC077027]|uniref:hypothetical protein n=1 Tax=Bacillus sp. NPDC077027 TaxID=3390548 RepID=UPI003D0313E8
MLTSKEIENLLAKEEYAPIKRIKKKDLTDEQRQEVTTIESIVSFGEDIITLFDFLLDLKETLPTQKCFVDSGVNKMLSHLATHKPEIEVTPIMVEACKLRLTRTYMSKVIELHLEALVREQLPQYKMIIHPLIDSVMGIDMILETETKRHYIHVTSNTPMAISMLKRKESRGGYRVGKAYIPYNRDFAGDLVLKYDTNQDSVSTKIINGFPLFNSEFVVWRIELADMSVSFGESLTVPYSKLNHFNDWMKTYVPIAV